MKGEVYFRALLSGERCSIPDRLVFCLLRFVALIYGLAMRLRLLAYRSGLFRSYSLPVPVISIGNIVVGGTGKTPVTAWIADYFLKRGKKVAVLTRGYGGSMEGEVAIVSDGENRLLTPIEAGDEPCLLADMLPGLIVVMGSNRYQAGCLAQERFKPDIFLLDDGFQHLRLKRDLDILLLDAAKPLGNGFTFPAGFLREPAAAVRRADLAVFTRSEGLLPPNVLLSEKTVSVSAVHKLTGFRTLAGKETKPFAELQSLRGLAFAGIAAPELFFDALEKEGLTLASTLAFPDHTIYGDAEYAALARLRSSSRADYLITTAKDAIKLQYSGGEEAPFYVASLEMVFRDVQSLSRELDKFL